MGLSYIREIRAIPQDETLAKRLTNWSRNLHQQSDILLFHCLQSFIQTLFLNSNLLSSSIGPYRQINMGKHSTLDYRYVLIITKSEMIIFHCFCCFWASLGLIPWAIARYAPAVLHPNLLQNQLKTIES